MRVPVSRRRQMKNKSVLCRPFTMDQESMCQLLTPSTESAGNYKKTLKTSLGSSALLRLVHSDRLQQDLGVQVSTELCAIQQHPDSKMHYTVSKYQANIKYIYCTLFIQTFETSSIKSFKSVFMEIMLTILYLFLHDC